jgi:chromosome segregation ATPase
VGKQDDLIKIERAIKDCEIRLKTFYTNISIIQKEVDLLSVNESKLQENIDCLKNNKAAVLAVEYRKSKEDLKKTKVRLSQLRSDLGATEKAHRDIQNFLTKNKEAYDKLANSNENNVLLGKFGKLRV